MSRWGRMSGGAQADHNRSLRERVRAHRGLWFTREERTVREVWPDGEWNEVVVPNCRHAGQRLGDLRVRDADWYFTKWRAVPRTEVNVEFRRLLDGLKEAAWAIERASWVGEN